MIVTRTPLRLSFLGGGTDYPDHYLRKGGQTLGAAMARYTFVTVKSLPELFNYRVRAAYSQIELKDSASEVEHPAIRECMRFTGIDAGLEISVVSDLPARSGVGSSSSFTVGLLNALHHYQGRTVSRQKLAAEAVYVEQVLIKEHVGVQDQYTCATGGIVHVTCRKDGAITVNPVPVAAHRLAQLEDRLVLYYTGRQRTAHDVLPEQMERTRSGANDASLDRLYDLVPDGIEVLTGNRPLQELGELLHEGWLAKRDMSSKVSSPEIDAYYSAARTAGAVGGKLMGAGSGGFLLMYVEPERQADVARVLAGLPALRTRFDFAGTSMVFAHPEAEDVVTERQLSAAVSA